MRYKDLGELFFFFLKRKQWSGGEREWWELGYKRALGAKDKNQSFGDTGVNMKTRFIKICLRAWSEGGN